MFTFFYLEHFNTIFFVCFRRFRREIVGDEMERVTKNISQNLMLRDCGLKPGPKTLETVAETHLVQKDLAELVCLHFKTLSFCNDRFS